MSNKRSTRGRSSASSRNGKGKRSQSTRSVDTRKAASSKKSTKRSTKAQPRAASVARRGASRPAKKGRGGGARARAKRREMRVKILRAGAYWAAVAAVWAVMLFGGLITYYTLTMPDPHLVGLSKESPNIKILSASGTVIAERGRQRRHSYLEDLPSYVKDAVLLTEDRRFYSHFGIDLEGLGRATVVNLRAGRVVQGGSTITQQLAKNLFLTPERTFGRKVHEMLMALWLETVMTKDEILELYLNRVYFGAGAYGVGEAADRYFGKSAESLTLAEAATLAGLLKAPSRYALTHNAEGARERAKVVIANMVAAGKITKKQGQVAVKVPLKLTKALRYAHGYDYAVDWVDDLLPGLVGHMAADLIVKTTIDQRLQASMQKTVEHVMAGASEMVAARQAAAVILDASGAVKAMAGGRSYKESQFNRAVAAKRQPGSAFKPFVYLSAMEAGLTPDSIVEDKPVKVGAWEPKNYSGRYRGPVSLRESLAQSINSVAVRLMMNVGASRVIKTARRLGISAPLHSGPSLALGTSELSLLELTSGYVPFANGGYRIDPYVIKSVTTVDGRVLYRHKSQKRKKVIAGRDLSVMNDMLRAVVQRGTGRAAALKRHPAAGKTGTSQSFRDAWFVGYTAHYTAGVWIGNDDGSAMKDVSGGGLPAKIWRKVMSKAHEGLVPRRLPGKSSVPPYQAVMGAAQRQEGSMETFLERLAPVAGGG